MQNRWIYLSIILLLLNVVARESEAKEKLVPFENEGTWGYKNASRKVLIKPQFDMAIIFLPKGLQQLWTIGAGHI